MGVESSSGKEQRETEFLDLATFHRGFSGFNSVLRIHSRMDVELGLRFMRQSKERAVHFSLHGTSWDNPAQRKPIHCGWPLELS